MAIELTGKVEGSVRKHNEATLKAVWDNALLVLPQEQDPEHVIETTPAAAGNECFSDRYPTLIFAHGSSGITPAIREFARFIAQETGWAVVAPDSMQTKDRITYTSPVARSDYEAVHSMRSEELVYCANKLFADFVCGNASYGLVVVCENLTLAIMFRLRFDVPVLCTVTGT